VRHGGVGGRGEGDGGGEGGVGVGEGYEGGQEQVTSLYLLHLSALSLASPRAADSRTSGQGIKLCSAVQPCLVSSAVQPCELFTAVQSTVGALEPCYSRSNC
jgi:hypothetical protein